MIEDVKRSKEDEQDESDEDEETYKNVISSRGKFASFMQMRNSMIQPSGAPLKKQDPALKRASMILSKSFAKSFAHHDNEDMQLMVNPKNVHAEEVYSIFNMYRILERRLLNTLNLLQILPLSYYLPLLRYMGSLKELHLEFKEV